MITHKDPEIQFLINQIEQQRDLALSQSSAFYKKIVELTQKIEEIETTTKNKDNAIVSINKIKGEKMANTTFSGPIRAGDILDTTGTTLGTNV
jgi:uncharacterized coiled-coil DUF342 family protein